MQATRATPIVVLIIRDPIAAGLVRSLARPGGNITGVATEITPELSAKQLRLLKEAVPKFAVSRSCSIPTGNRTRHGGIKPTSRLRA
jgi:ABC-type uncharacterized transport system substrate-binding protein